MPLGWGVFGPTERRIESRPSSWSLRGALVVAGSLLLLYWVLRALIYQLFGACYPLGGMSRPRACDDEGSTPEAGDLYVGYGEPPHGGEATLPASHGPTAWTQNDCLRARLDALRAAGPPEGELVVRNLQAALWDEPRRRAVLELLEATLAEKVAVRVYCQCDPLTYLREETRFGPEVAGERGGGRRKGDAPAPVAADTAHVRRWASVLGLCRYHRAERNLPHELWQRLREPLSGSERVRTWLTNECGWDQGLHPIALDIVSADPRRPLAEWTYEDVVREVRSRAEVAFQVALQACTVAERLALARIAHEGFVNPKLWPEVLALEERGVVKRDDGLRIRSEAFACFLRTHVEPLEMERADKAQPGLWLHIRGPLVGITVVALAGLFLVAPEVGGVVAAVLTSLVAVASGLSRMLSAPSGAR